MNTAMKTGTEVVVHRDAGGWLRTVTRSEPWQLDGGQWVVLVEGIAGGYALERVKTAPPVQVPACDLCTVGIMDQSNPHLHGLCKCRCHVRAGMERIFREEMSRVDGLEREDIERRRAS